MKRFRKAPAYQGKHLVLHVSGGDRTIQDNEVLDGAFWAKFVGMGFLVPVEDVPVAAAAAPAPTPAPEKKEEPKAKPKAKPEPKPEPEPEPKAEEKVEEKAEEKAEPPVKEGQGTRSTAEKMATILGKKTSTRKRRK